MTKTQDRYAVPVNPAMRARMERQKARRAAALQQRELGFTTGYLVRSAALAFLVGLLAFSLQWANGLTPALIAGVVGMAVVAVLAWVFRLMQRRSAARR